MSSHDPDIYMPRLAFIAIRFTQFILAVTLLGLFAGMTTKYTSEFGDQTLGAPLLVRATYGTGISAVSSSLVVVSPLTSMLTDCRLL